MHLCHRGAPLGVRPAPLGVRALLAEQVDELAVGIRQVQEGDLGCAVNEATLTVAYNGRSMQTSAVSPSTNPASCSNTSEDQAGSRHPRRCRPRLHRPRPVVADVIGWRSPACETLARAFEAIHGPHALYPRRTHHRAHFDDIKKLLGVVNRLVDAGNTMVVIEHNLDVIKTADWIIEVRPEGGHAGGKILATGTPEQIANAPTTATGSFLSNLL